MLLLLLLRFLTLWAVSIYLLPGQSWLGLVPGLGLCRSMSSEEREREREGSEGTYINCYAFFSERQGDNDILLRGSLFRFSIKKKGRTDGRHLRDERERERERGAYEGILNSRGCRDWSPFNPTQPSTHIHTRYAQKEEEKEKEKEKQKIEGVLSSLREKNLFSPEWTSRPWGHSEESVSSFPTCFFFYFTTSASFFLHLGADNTHTHIDTHKRS